MKFLSQPLLKKLSPDALLTYEEHMLQIKALMTASNRTVAAMQKELFKIKLNNDSPAIEKASLLAYQEIERSINAIEQQFATAMQPYKFAVYIMCKMEGIDAYDDQIPINDQLPGSYFKMHRGVEFLVQEKQF